MTDKELVEMGVIIIADAHCCGEATGEQDNAIINKERLKAGFMAMKWFLGQIQSEDSISLDYIKACENSKKFLDT